MADIGEKSARTLIVCFDGTSNEYDGYNTNIVKLTALLKKDDYNQQLCYYQPGIGTWFNPGVVSPFFRWGAKVLDEALAWYLDEHVIEGYKFLMQNYRIGDKICIFGFSRGSYTARALAGFLYKAGLLPKDNEQQVPFAYKLYKREDKAGLGLCAGFKQTFCQDVKVEFVGVWDTVASVGVLAGRTLPFTNSNKAIKTFRHALSLDERRAKFRPNFYHRPQINKAKAKVNAESNNLKPKKCFWKSDKFCGTMKRLKEPLQMFFIDPEPEDDGTPDTDVLEVWFSGCHGDVGGGSTADAVTHSLSNITLRWMVRQIQETQCGILFDKRALDRAGIPLTIFPERDTDSDIKSPSPEPVINAESKDEITLDEGDAMQPLDNELKVNPLWWLLEYSPLTYAWQDQDGVWHRKLSINRGRGRKIEDPNPFFHETVKLRRENPKMKYKPKARWMEGSEVYVY